MSVVYTSSRIRFLFTDEEVKNTSPEVHAPLSDDCAVIASFRRDS